MYSAPDARMTPWINPERHWHIDVNDPKTVTSRLEAGQWLRFRLGKRAKPALKAPGRLASAHGGWFPLKLR